MDRPLDLAGYDVGGPLGPGLLAARSRLDGSAVTVEVLPDADPARAHAVSEQVRRADGRHLVRVRAVLVEPQGVVVVRDAVEGSDLEQERLSLGGTLPPAAAAAAVADVLDALEGLHARGLVHGALRPADVRLDASVPLRPVVRLTGWGAPGLRGLPALPGDDVRDAARLLVHLLTGSARGPLDPEHARILDPVLVPMRADDPAARPTAGQARDALRALPLGALPAPAPRRREPWRPARPLVLAGLGVLLLTVLAAALLLTRSPEPAPVRAAPSASPVPDVVASYAFPAQSLPGDLVVERTWALEDGGAVLRSRTVVRNDGDAISNAGVVEVVPSSVARDVAELTFRPPPAAVLREDGDPVVRFDLLGLAPGATTRWEHVATLPFPATASSLLDLAEDAERARRAYDAAAVPSPPPD